ncbi:hypothetical protein GQ42DRAFT_164524 [Ramicandelaber brevisporus]|nr:hypothetical protein GQ42DRAFT_164524 [Ramicandelaber brevisporus]
MRTAFASTALAVTFVSTVCAQSFQPTVPATVDPAKPDTIKTYYKSVSSEFMKVESSILSFIPSEKHETATRYFEYTIAVYESAVATETDPSKLASLATKIASVEQQVKQAAADIKSAAASIQEGMKGLVWNGSAVSDISVSAAHLAAGTFAGVAAFAALF